MTRAVDVWKGLILAALLGLAGWLIILSAAGVI